MWKLITITFCAALFTGTLAAEWSYTGAHGPDHWEDDYADCALERQSPINIETAMAQNDRNLENDDLEFHGYDSTANLELELLNNGHAAQVNIKAGEVSITGANLLQPYHLAQFHFHWGSNSGQGSEHLMDGEAFPMEVHFVHYADEWETLGAAADKTRGLAVLGFFFKVGEHNNHFDEIVNNLANVRGDGDTLDIQAFNLDTLLPTDSKYFYRYEGSLTTPGCYQSVVWTVFENPIMISEPQLEEFRALMGDGHHIVDNYRPVQPINWRAVSTNKETEVEPPPSASSAPFASVLAVLISAVLAKLMC